MTYPPKSKWLWNGCAAGAFGALAICIWQIATDHPSWHYHHRTTGFTHPIQFGNLALLLGLISLTGMPSKARHIQLQRFWLIFGAVCGFLASLLSGSRGGWILFPTILIATTIYLTLHKQRIKAFLLVTIAALLLCSTLIIPQSRIIERIETAKKEVIAYNEAGDATTSVGARLQMWEFAWKLFTQKPLVGWTQLGYSKEIKTATNRKELDPIMESFNHPHNEMLDSASKRGALGLLALLLTYMTPLLIFTRHFKAASTPEQRRLAIAGALIPIAYIVFGLTQSFLPHNSGTMMYFYMTSYIWATLYNAKMKVRTDGT